MSDPIFDVSDMTQGSLPHPGKKSLKKSAGRMELSLQIFRLAG
jgi:hypothetical protein